MYFFFLGLLFTQHFKINLHDGMYQWASLVAQMIKNLLAKGRTEFNPWVRKIPWRKEWLPTPVFLPGGSYGQRSLVGYSPRGCKESDRTERLTLSHFHVSIVFLS